MPIWTEDRPPHIPCGIKAYFVIYIFALFIYNVVVSSALILRKNLCGVTKLSYLNAFGVGEVIMDLKGQKMLKVVGILMIIGGALSIVFTIASIGLIIYVANAVGGMVPILLILVLPLIASVIELIAGILGVKAAGMPSVGKIKTAVVLGIVILVLSLVSMVYSTLMSSALGSSVTDIVVDAVAGLVLPALYLVAVFRYKNALVKLLSGE